MAMSCMEEPEVAADAKSEYSTAEDFRALFSEHVNDLYLLSFLLTGNHEMAELCFVAGLDDCVNGNEVFQEWARSWARRVIIRNAIRMVAPTTGSAMRKPGAFDPQDVRGSSPTSSPDVQFEGILRLDDLERFVYVLSVLERYSEQDCAALLEIPRQKVRDARIRAMQQVADSSEQPASATNEIARERPGRRES